MILSDMNNFVGRSMTVDFSFIGKVHLVVRVSVKIKVWEVGQVCAPFGE